MLEPLRYLLGAVSAGLVGFTLALVGGGGSIPAVPLIVYLFGVYDAHFVIGTSAVAVAGYSLGKAVEGEHLLLLFALLMLALVVMLRKRPGSERSDVECDRTNAPKLIGFRVGTGVFSGFFEGGRHATSHAGPRSTTSLRF